MSNQTARDREAHVAFRRLTRDDFPMLMRWLSDPDVAAWYEEGAVTPERIEARYGRCIDGIEPTNSFIILIDERPGGYIQAYFIGDFPGYETDLQIEPDYASTDLLLGEPDIRGHGWGVPVLRAFHRQFVFGELGATRALIAPSPNNHRAIKVYERTGFSYLKTVPVYDPDLDVTDDEMVMVMTRDEFFADDPDAPARST